MCVWDFRSSSHFHWRRTNYPGNLVKFLIIPPSFEYNKWWQLGSISFGDSTTVTLIFSWPVLLRGIDLLPTKSTAVSPGMSSHTGVSSMAMIWSNEYCFFSLRLRTSGNRPAIFEQAHQEPFVLWRKVIWWRRKKLRSYPLLATKSL